jgi:hypothetical protein
MVSGGSKSLREISCRFAIGGPKLSHTHTTKNFGRALGLECFRSRGRNFQRQTCGWCLLLWLASCRVFGGVLKFVVQLLRKYSVPTLLCSG